MLYCFNLVHVQDKFQKFGQVSMFNTLKSLKFIAAFIQDKKSLPLKQ